MLSEVKCAVEIKLWFGVWASQDQFGEALSCECD